MIKRTIKNKTKRGIILIASIACLAFITISANQTHGKKRSYYTGDAIRFNNATYIGTTNTDKFELFVLKNGTLLHKASVVSPDYKYDKFYDVKFIKDGNNLYAYLVNGKRMYKYNITNPMTPKLTKTINDNSWYWFSAVDEFNGQLATIGNKGVKIWNDNMQVINTYNVINKDSAENISFSENGTFIFNIVNGHIKVFDTQQRQYVLDIKLETKDNHIRKIYNNTEDSTIYVVDDKSIKKYDFRGNLKKEFVHTGHIGYDVIESNYGNNVYFSDGKGIVKTDKEGLIPNDWKYTTSLTPNGGWAMGIKVVSTGYNNENIVIFNGSNILVLDNNLEMIDYIEATEEDNRPKEALYLKLDKNRGVGGSLIALRGGGFAPNDNLTIEFGNKTLTLEADKNGRFNRIIGVPNILPTRTDIKVTGELSGLSYSISFEIE